MVLANDFKLANRERVSVYLHDGCTAFRMVARYSKNPEFNKTAREKYPDDEGCIAEAWRNGMSYVANLPDASKDLKAYQDTLLEKFRIPKKTSRSFNMQSRCYGATAFDGKSGNRIAVLVIESTEPSAFTEERITTILGHPELAHIMNAIEIMGSFEPNLAYAKKEGY